MNRYRFKVYEWNGDSFNVLLYASDIYAANTIMFYLYPDAPAATEGELIEGAEPLSWFRKLLYHLRMLKP